MDRDVVRLARQWLRSRVRLQFRSRMVERPILISSTRRSGSTLVREMLHSQPGVTYSDQPLDLWRYHPHRKQLPNPPFNAFITLTDEEKGLLKEYLDSIFALRRWVYAPWRVWTPSFSLVANRVVVKELNAKPLLPWLVDTFDVDVVYLIRHPLPTVLSILRRGWGVHPEAFLQDDRFRVEVLGEERARACDSLASSGDRLVQGVLEWALENHVPLETPSRWSTVTYEEIVLRPQTVADWLATRLGLPDPERMRDAVRRPVSLDSASRRDEIATSSGLQNVTRWQRELDPRAAADALAPIADVLSRREYSANSATPGDSMLVGGPLPVPEQNQRSSEDGGP